MGPEEISSPTSFSSRVSMESSQGAQCVVQLCSEILKDRDDNFSEQLASLAGCAYAGFSLQQSGSLLCWIMLVSRPPAVHFSHLIQVANITRTLALNPYQFGVSLFFHWKYRSLCSKFKLSEQVVIFCSPLTSCWGPQPGKHCQNTFPVKGLFSFSIENWGAQWQNTSLIGKMILRRRCLAVKKS